MLTSRHQQQQTTQQTCSGMGWERLRAQKKIGCVLIAGRCWSKRIYSLSCLFCCSIAYVLEKYISFLSFSIYKADRPTHVCNGRQTFPLETCTPICVSDDALCVFVCCWRTPSTISKRNPASTRLYVRIFKSFFLVVHRSVNTSARHISSGHKGASVGSSSSTKFFDDFFFLFFFPCLCHSLFLPPLMRFLHIIIVYNWIEILPMRGCCCVHVEDVTWAPTDGLFIFRCTE